jgi:hypothetical protein
VTGFPRDALPQGVRVVPVIPAVLVAFLGGCADPGPGPEGASGTSTSGGLAPAGTSTTGAPEPAPEAANRTSDIPYSFQGRTWTTACVFAQPAVGRCQHLAEGSALTEPFPAERIVRIQGTLGWTGGNEVMGIGLVWEEDGQLMASGEAYAEGPSPLAFDWDVAALSDRSLAYHVASYVSAGVPQAHVDASPGQDWSLEATLTALA